MAGQHNYPYKKGIDITAWVFQMLGSIVLVGVSGFAISVIDSYGYGGVLDIGAIIIIVISALTIIFDITEIVLISKRNMHPALYLSFACIKTLLWFIMLILQAAGQSALGAIITAILFITSAVQLGQGATIIHRKRKGTLTGGNYAPAINPDHVEVGYSKARPPSYGNDTAYTGH
ncbi:hypothetical protein GGR50DRAFT_689756 [Xylaria sp. CBS 124048]|nr:hypothetical protein GGR50DRAFT_689756 [Xylaria sp. CBS 124048]